MKKLCIWMALATLLLALVGCGEKEYKTVPAGELSEAMIEAIGDSSSEYLYSTENHYEIYFGEHEAYGKLADASMVFSRAETDVNEFGVFRANTAADAAVLKTMIEEYVADQTEMLRSFAANYSPTDMEKIDNAAVEVKGNYVFYYILSQADEDAIRGKLEELLTVK